MSETWDEVTKAAQELRDQWGRCAPPAADAVIDRCVQALTVAVQAHAAAQPKTPLEALDAAERALLVAGGWREEDAGFWKLPDGVSVPRADALAIEREDRGGAS